jgi:sialic acid synthase SpsE
MFWKKSQNWKTKLIICIRLRLKSTEKVFTGMATKEEIKDALDACGECPVALLKCTSAYPARPEDANLRTIKDMTEEFDVPVGLSDHTMGGAVPVTAITQGACIIEKHFVLDRARDKGPDSSFSMEPAEFRAMVDAVRAAEKDPSAVHIDEQILGAVRYGPTAADQKSLVFRPSVFVVEDMAAGESFTEKNVRVIRPGYGLPPKEFAHLLGKRCSKNIARGTPLSKELVA